MLNFIWQNKAFSLDVVLCSVQASPLGFSVDANFVAKSKYLLNHSL